MLIGCLHSPQKSGIPRLEFAIKTGYLVEIGIVRVRNVATCVRKKTSAFSSAVNEESGSSVLKISEVHDMVTFTIDRGDETTYISEPFKGNLDKGELATWFEISMESKAVTSAFRENENIELGDEPTWSPEELRDAGAFETLTRAAIDTVKRIDGVGYWSNNNQDSMIHGRPPGDAREANQGYRSPGAYKEVYW